MNSHPNLIATGLTIAAVGGVSALARHRIRYWQEWARNVYDNLEGNLLDRLDVEPEMTDLAP